MRCQIVFSSIVLCLGVFFHGLKSSAETGKALQLEFIDTQLLASGCSCSFAQTHQIQDRKALLAIDVSAARAFVKFQEKTEKLERRSSSANPGVVFATQAFKENYSNENTELNIHFKPLSLCKKKSCDGQKYKVDIVLKHHTQSLNQTLYGNCGC